MDNDRFVADPPEGFKKLEPVNGFKRIVPDIAWGHVFEGWKQARQIRYLKEFCRSMNHAADLLQKERNALNVVVADKEKMIRSMYKKYEEQTTLLNQELTSWNKNKQELLEEIMILKKKVKDLEDGSKY